MKLTTGFDFQGYFIEEYIDVIFDEMLVGIGLGKSIISTIDNMFSSLTGSEATAMIEKLNDVKSELRDRVVKKAQQLGANALIGIDFESSKLGDLIMVSMTATAVKIERIVSPLPTTERELKNAEEAELKAKAQEERERKLEYLREHPNEFDVESVIQDLNALQSTKERADYIRRVIAENPNNFSDELTQQLEHKLHVERMYGRGSGLTNTLREYFNTP